MIQSVPILPVLIAQQFMALSLQRLHQNSDCKHQQAARNVPLAITTSTLGKNPGAAQSTNPVFSNVYSDH